MTPAIDSLHRELQKHFKQTCFVFPVSDGYIVQLNDLRNLRVPFNHRHTDNSKVIKELESMRKDKPKPKPKAKSKKSKNGEV